MIILRLFKIIFLQLLIILLLSCSNSGVNNLKSTVNIPNQWPIYNIPMTSANLPYLAWWKRFHDPMLNQLLQSGLQYNNNVQQARANLQMAKQELRRIQLSWIPTLELFAGFSQNPIFGSPGLFAGALPGYYSFNVFTNLVRQGSAKISIEAQNYALQSTKLILIGQIVRGYYTYLATVDRQRLLEKYTHDLQELLDILKDDYKGGLKSKIPVASLMQDLEQEKSRLHSLSADVVTAQNALRYLVNLNPGPLPRGTNFYQIETSYPSIGVLPATVLANRPDVAFAEAQFRLARHEVKVSQTYLLPAVQLDNFFGHIRQGVSFSAATDAYTMWTIDPSVFGEIAELNSAAKKAYFAYIDTVRKALQEVANDYTIHEIANTRYQDILRSYQAAQEVDSLNQALYKEGIIAYKKVLLNRLNVDRTALKLNSIKLVQMLSLVNLYQDLGGGYRS